MESNPSLFEYRLDLVIHFSQIDVGRVTVGDFQRRVIKGKLQNHPCF